MSVAEVGLVEAGGVPVAAVGREGRVALWVLQALAVAVASVDVASVTIPAVAVTGVARVAVPITRFATTGVAGTAVAVPWRGGLRIAIVAAGLGAKFAARPSLPLSDLVEPGARAAGSRQKAQCERVGEGAPS